MKRAILVKKEQGNMRQLDVNNALSVEKLQQKFPETVLQITLKGQSWILLRPELFIDFNGDMVLFQEDAVIDNMVTSIISKIIYNTFSLSDFCKEMKGLNASEACEYPENYEISYLGFVEGLADAYYRIWVSMNQNIIGNKDVQKIIDHKLIFVPGTPLGLLDDAFGKGQDEIYKNLFQQYQSLQMVSLRYSVQQMMGLEDQDKSVIQSLLREDPLFAKEYGRLYGHLYFGHVIDAYLSEALGYIGNITGQATEFLLIEKIPEGTLLRETLDSGMLSNKAKTVKNIIKKGLGSSRSPMAVFFENLGKNLTPEVLLFIKSSHVEFRERQLFIVKKSLQKHKRNLQATAMMLKKYLQVVKEKKILSNYEEKVLQKVFLLSLGDVKKRGREIKTSITDLDYFQEGDMPSDDMKSSAMRALFSFYWGLKELDEGALFDILEKTFSPLERKLILLQSQRDFLHVAEYKIALDQKQYSHLESSALLRIIFLQNIISKDVYEYLNDKDPDRREQWVKNILLSEEVLTKERVLEMEK